MELLIKILIVFGISSIVTISKLFEPLRDFTEKYSPNFWNYLTSCMQCLPFWIGMFVSFVFESPLKVENEMLPSFLNVFISYLFSGALFSGTTMFIHTIFVHLKGENWNKTEEMDRLRKIKKGIIKEG